MLNKIIGISGVVLATLVVAPSTVTGMNLNKEQWLDKLKDVAPVMLCKSFTENEDVNKLMLASKINYDKCLTLVPTSFDKCRTQYSLTIPSTIDDVSAAKWGSTLGNCIGADFAAANFTSTGSLPPKKVAASTGTGTTKELWLNDLTTFGPKLMCANLLSDKSTQKKLKKFHIDNEKCLALIPASVTKCETQYSPGMPATLDKANGSKWGKKIGRCIGRDFARQHLM